MTPTGVKFCPHCGSKDIDWVLPHDRSKWQCPDCGYIGALIVEDGVMADEIRKAWLEERQGENG